ncbi:hypothetical protein F0P96_13210 [Hymenobacter busanensis]|uniref:Uncharacterized protein n=1 Tax=Hymenobacter busanensis TaxID=2607656 RepID=A0A7L4ZWJ2_9BACT|nr:hypothetical protein [Hymenobacter busanensis]KAA9332426.1 hypothetical protein F0P96_13210 [Hymenobacter busanensis]QHJ07236.1 hypothetical protein GUY19_08060 [Hymenobacter busanensis]
MIYTLHTRLHVAFNENYLDVPLVKALFYEAMDAGARFSRGWSDAPATVTFTIYGRYSALSLQRFQRLLHHHDSFARLLVNGQPFA